MDTPIEIMYGLMKDYIYPILDFAEIYVSEEGFLKPKNSPDPSLSYKYEERPLVVISSNAQQTMIKSQKEFYEPFNPIFVPRQAVFLANMVMQSANRKSDIVSGNLVYDEDLDEYIESEKGTKNKASEIRMFHMKDAEYGITNRISFSYTDPSGNPVGEELAGYAHDNVVLATIGASINLAKKFKKFLSPLLVNTDVAILKIMDGIAKYRRENQKDKDALKTDNINVSADDDYYNSDSSDFDDIILDDSLFKKDDGLSPESILMNPWDKRNDFSPNVEGAKIWKGMVMPDFRTLSVEEAEDERDIRNAKEIKDFLDFDDMAFNN
ncbi:MAG: hypothetical protein IJ772_04770 [Bacilli bacterium]|nr:hypothetical protein [Bacilli bacterium]